MNGVYCLLRNLPIERGLVKNTRCHILQLGTRLVTIQPLTPNSQPMDCEPVLIPRITFTHVLPSGHTFVRRQFPLAAAYATTFHSCQGLTLARVGIDLSSPIFAHGQLYTAASRIRKRNDGCVRLPADGSRPLNVVYPELLA